MPRMQRLSGDYELRDVRRRQIIWGFVSHRKDSSFHSKQDGKPLEEFEQGEIHSDLGFNRNTLAIVLRDGCRESRTETGGPFGRLF